jgi:thiamine-phosphate diphosphorylase
MVVSDDALLAGRDPVGVARAAARGGATAFQLRLKLASPRELVILARRLIASIELPLFVNDRPDVALAAGAAGVHLGPEDLPIALARRIARRGFIIGASVGSPEEAKLAGGADYWGIGPWRSTTTKADAGPALGQDGFRSLVQHAGGRPCIAIGSVQPGDVAQVRAAGGVGVAVAAGIVGAEDVEAATRAYALALG